MRRMRRVRVKIEGLRDPGTAVRIAELGADAVGLVFAESPRRVTCDQAREIVAALPPWVATVGVFVNEHPGAINAIVAHARIGYVQLHGDEGPDLVGQINARCIKAFRVRDQGWLDDVRRWLDGLAASDHFAAVLLDAYNPKVRGGTGQAFNWSLVAEAREAGKTAGIDPIILAGGLNPACVAEAIRTVRPWAVDVASGVEASPGVKDLAKVSAFLDAAWGAEA